MTGETIVGEKDVAQVFTVGHSTHQLERLVDLLERHRVERLVDVRKMPASRRMPHFSKEALSDSLPAAGIAYEHVGELGGFRRPEPGSPNGGWRVPAFQAYADHMGTPEFEEAL